MKDLFRKSSKPGNSRATRQEMTGNSSDVRKFLDKVASMPPVSRTTDAKARLLFSLDATASRQMTWDRASRLQAEMFVNTQSLGSLRMQLCYFRGLSEFSESDWQSTPGGLLDRMAGIRCEAGLTQIERLLHHALRENRIQKLRAVIYIGDAMEEDVSRLCQLAGQLGLLNVPLFIFQEGRDANAQRAFMEMARLSSGAYGQFDASSAKQLRDLLSAVAIFAAGGLSALEAFSRTSHESVRLLTQQLKDL